MKKFSCFPLVGTTYDDISLATAPVSEIGCTSFKSISGNYMLSDSNICMFSLGQVVEVSNTHNSVIGQLSFITKNATFSACDSVNRRRIFHVNDGNIFVVHEKYGNAITSWSGLNASCMAEVQSRTIANIILVGDATSGKIKIFNPNISAAYIPNTFIKTRYDDMNEIQEKVWRAILPEIEVTDGENYSINISYDIDYQNVEGETSFLGSIDNIAVFGEDYWGQAYYSNSIGKTRLKNDFQLHTAKGGRLSIELSTQNRIKFLGMTQKFRLIGRK
jgi:hypothetical protein